MAVISHAGKGTHHLDHRPTPGDIRARKCVDLDSQSLRGFLRLVETQYPDELLRDPPADRPAFRCDGAGVRARPGGEEPGGGVRERERQRHAAGHQRLPATASCWPPASASNLAICPRRFANAARNTFPARPSDRGAWEDVVIEGDDVDLTKLPVPLQFTGRCGALHHRRPDRRAATP